MRRPWRARLTAAERTELWQRWRQGQSLCAIGRALDRFPTTLNREVRSTGGFTPPPRKRNPGHLWLAEREEILRGLSARRTFTQIAAQLGRSVSTVCREVARDGGASTYRATVADSRAWERAKRPEPCKLATYGPLRRIVASKLLLDWSLEVEDRAVPGHWEGDLIERSGATAIATLVERHSRFTMLVKVRGKDTEGVTAALAKQVRKLPVELPRSLT